MTPSTEKRTSLPEQLSGLYVITNNEPFDLLMEKLRIVATFPCVRLIQYRRKQISKANQITEAKQLQQLCIDHDIHFIINDDMHLAQQLTEYGACGVHLGQNDGGILTARNLLGKSAIIGRTCHQSLDLAIQAASEGASYVAFGAYRPSISKTSVTSFDSDAIPQLLTQAASSLTLPICMIGGIQPTDTQKLLDQGVKLIAVINSALGGSLIDVKNQMQHWQRQFDHYLISRHLTHT